jgi:uncharacterized protein (TIGR00299 family) protein
LILHIDLSTGASGDKLMGALLELCESLEVASFDDLLAVAQALVADVVINRTQVIRGGINATHLTVQEFDEQGEPAHTHRSWSDIRKLIEVATQSGAISKTTATLATTAFEFVANAEAAVHGVPVEQVHFHEVGAADSIIDIVCSSFLLDKLQPTAVFATALALGNGTVVCAHGELPVPAPATARIIAGFCSAGGMVYAGVHQGELTTPTGAALIRTFVTDFAPLPCSQPLTIGCGAGSREIPGTANVVRIIAAAPKDLAGLKANPDTNLSVEGIAELQANIDHRSSEALAFICEKLLELGALDVWQESITMKKGRLAIKLCLICHVNQAQEFAKQILELTGSLGVRSRYIERTVVPRKVVIIDTPYGEVPFKATEFGDPGNRTTWIRPEHDAVAIIAKQQDLDYQTLYDKLIELGAKVKGKGSC